MLFLKDGKNQDKPHAVYLLGEDMEAVLRKQIDRQLVDHGYTVGERADVSKDMNFLRNKRQLMEQTVRQAWAFMVRATLVALGALLVLGLKGYFKL